MFYIPIYSSNRVNEISYFLKQCQLYVYNNLLGHSLKMVW